MKCIMFAVVALTILASPGLAAAPGDEQKARQLAAQFPNAQPHVEKALEGDPKAMKTLGVLFEVLRGDHAQAAHWYRLAALSRNARAQLLLANSYQHGRGVPKSNTLAFAWYMVASAECGQKDLAPESFNGPTPSKDELEAARETALLFRMLAAKFASEPDCSEYFDTGTKKRAVPSQRWQGSRLS